MNTMLHIMLAIAPIFLLIILGHALRRGGIPSTEFWNLNDRLVYWVLFPSLLFYKVATMDLSGVEIGRFATVIYTGFFAAILFALIAGKLLRLERPIWTSVLQGCGRHNTFIALAVAERVFGGDGLALATLVSAMLIPVTNITIVTLMVSLLQGANRRGVVKAITRELARNPLLIAVCLGLAVNYSGVQDIPVLYEMVRILGAAALPIVLLCVGANLRIRAMVLARGPTVVTLFGKMVVFPLALGLSGTLLGLDDTMIMIALIFGAVPTAAGAYTLARQLGGDAPAMAAMVTVQTALSFLTLPLTLQFARALLGT